jgi:hypothetical protein
MHDYFLYPAVAYGANSAQYMKKIKGQYTDVIVNPMDCTVDLSKGMMLI